MLIGPETNMDFSVRQFCQRLKAFFECLFPTPHDEIIIRCQRCAAEGADENGLGFVVRVGHGAKRPLAQLGPKAALQHGCFDCICIHRNRRGFAIRGCRTSGFEIRFHNHLQKFAFLASHNGFHLSADG